MTVQELKSAFVYAYSKEADTIYFASGRVNLIGEHIIHSANHESHCSLSFGIYLLLSKNNDKQIKLWSLNEPEVICLNLNELTSSIENTWIKYPISIFVQFIKLGVDIQEGYDIMIWGNMPNESTLHSSTLLEALTAYALNEQLGTIFNETIIAQICRKSECAFTF